MFSKTRCLVLSLIVVLAVCVPARSARAASDLLPDLGMARLRELKIQSTADGRRLLRFTSVAVNIGPGPIELRAQRPNTTSEMTVEQRIYDNGGGSRYISTPGTMVFGGDGHNHWHVRNFETYELDRLDNGAKVGTGVKGGFCFFDSEPFGAIAYPAYTSSNSCKGGPSGLQTTMGISRGWGDRYGASLPDQYIDITALNSGQYRLVAIADPSNWFLEANETNNSSWVDIQLTGSSLEIRSYGFSAKPIPGNQLTNRGFEADSNGDNQPDGWTSNSKFTRSNEVVREGSYSGKHLAADDSGYTIEQTLYDIHEGMTYRFSGYVNIPSTNDTFTLSLAVKWRNLSNGNIRIVTFKNFSDDTGGVWSPVVADLVAPAGTNNAKIRMVITSLKGTIYVDDFAFGLK